MHRATLAGLLAAFAFPLPAVAGGWWSHVEVRPQTVAAGQRVAVRQYVTFEAVPRSTGPFYVYLLRGLDERSFFTRAISRPGRWSLGNAELTRIERVKVSYSHLSADAHASFTLPSLPPGRYDVAFCTLNCRRSLGDTLPGGFTVAADRATADLAKRVERLELRADQQASIVWHGGAAQERVRARVRALQHWIRVERKRQRDLPGIWLITGGLLTALSLFGSGLLIGRFRGGRRARHDRTVGATSPAS